MAPRVALLGWTLAVTLGAAGQASTQRARLPSGDRAALVNHAELYLEAQPLEGEGLFAFCRRLTGSTAALKEIERLNRRPRRLLAGTHYRVPYGRLSADLQLGVVRALFPQDRAEPQGWLHVAGGESVLRMAEWFTGSRNGAAAIRAANQLRGNAVRAGTKVRIPAKLLRPIFRAAAPSKASTIDQSGAGLGETSGPVAAGDATPSVDPEDEVSLEYGEDAQGRFALYRLRGGEALYSAVVVRFTGRDHADDVNSLAKVIAERSGIADVTNIPIGYPIKVPFDYLLPQYLPESDPRRLEWEVERKLADQFRNPVRATALAGVTVVLDAGHGGADVGASRSGVWESVYVYDVVLRIQRALEARTRAHVELTTRDGNHLRPIDQDVLPYSRQHEVLTTPPYPISDATTGVHLRWYLANSIYRHHASKNDGDRIVFVSVHADSLHPSLRGATAYVPNVAGMAGTFGKSGSVFAARREYREQPRVRFSLGDRQKSVGRSRDLADRVIRAFRARGLEVHPFQPVRDRIFRGRRAWVPAVLRYNEIPAKMLLEICNIANSDDRHLLQTRQFREQIAEAVVDGILAYFGEGR